MSCVLATLNLLFPNTGTEVLSDRAVDYAVLTALLTALWWVGALLAPPLTAPPLSDGPGPAAIPARLPRHRATRATLLPSLFLPVLPLVVVRTIGAHAGPLEPAMTVLTVLAALVSLVLFRFWLGGLMRGGGPARPRELRRDAAAGTVTARRVRAGPALWSGEGSGSWDTSRRLLLSADYRRIELRTADEEGPQFPWLDLEAAAVLRDREGWLCWAVPQPTWIDTVDQVGAALVTDDGYVVWGATDRIIAETAYRSGDCSHPTATRRVRRAPRASLYRPDVHGYALAMAAVTLLALVVAERGVGPDPLSWCLALVAAVTGTRGVYGYTGRLAGRPGPGWDTSASAQGQHGRRTPEAPPTAHH